MESEPKSKQSIHQLIKWYKISQSTNKRRQNVDKHLRLATATRGHEHKVHLEKATKLLDKYEKQPYKTT